eukprot:TRINITY_DN14890_c0_g1_i2.p1 TRINITY_DN14890_c0_g1~~TRINITY_DN14890_c0_g1_i2.p1  ORF type:complete len:285 (-),score=39.61 TRINITY_DN14890_c0_g1_i2:318-1172(-)
MTSASELLYQRRFRIGRNSAGFVDLSEPSSRPNSGFNHHRVARRNDHNNHEYRHSYRCRSSLRSRNLLDRLTETNRENHSLEHISSRTTIHDADSQYQRSSNFFSAQAIENDNLRGTVVQQARNRLYERLRASSLVRNTLLDGTGSTTTGNAHSVRGPTVNNVDVLEVRYDRDRVSSRSRLFEAEDIPLRHVLCRETKPQGLSREDINALVKEEFIPKLQSESKGYRDDDSSLEQEDCSICLESFLAGEQLTRLKCQHRFHSICLTTWLRICGDCPYCRANALL